MATRERPLSPFMHYRWQYSNTLSILNRVTGVFQSIGLLLFVYWLAALASGPEPYAQAQAFFASIPVRIALAAWSIAFVYHLLNGIRHLVWDTGRGLERAPARRSGWAVIAGTVVLTIILWLLVAARFPGGAS